MAELVGAIDQGTTSTRFIIFDPSGKPVSSCQKEHRQLFPAPGWVEHDPVEVLECVYEVVARALGQARLKLSDLAAIGITNQRETVVMWDRATGRPYANAIVWQDTRSAPIIEALLSEGAGELVKAKTGLVPATYFSAGKLKWALANLDDLREGVRRGTACVGTIDSWLIWALTGGPHGGAHLTDLTNASRTMLMDLRSGSWGPELLALFDVPAEALPQIRPSSGAFGETAFDPAIFGKGVLSVGEALGGPRAKVPLLAALGDQQAAMVGQVCLRPGEAKSTYGTGNFLLVNTGQEILGPSHGLLATACYQLAGSPPSYALEGSVAVTGSAVQWLRDDLGIIGSAAEIEALASEVPDAGGAYFVPAFSGLFSPYWRADARGAIVGLTRATTKAQLARATLEAICFQTRDVVIAMQRALGRDFVELKVDGGITANSLCMQLQADILGIPVVKPVVTETTALGAAYAAGCAAGTWRGADELRQQWREQQRWLPAWTADRRQSACDGWDKAVQRSLGWVAAGRGQGG